MKKTRVTIPVLGAVVVAAMVSIVSGCDKKDSAASNAAATSPAAAASPAGAAATAPPPTAPEGQRYQELMKQNPTVKPNAR